MTGDDMIVPNAVAMYVSQTFPDLLVTVDGRHGNIDVDCEFGNLVTLTFVEDHCLINRDECDRVFVGCEDPSMFDIIVKSIRYSRQVMTEMHRIRRILESIHADA